MHNEILRGLEELCGEPPPPPVNCGICGTLGPPRATEGSCIFQRAFALQSMENPWPLVQPCFPGALLKRFAWCIVLCLLC
jgi:hypothetical protein